MPNDDTVIMVKLWSEGDSEHWVRTSLIDEIFLVATRMADDVAAEVRVQLSGKHHDAPVVASFDDIDDARQYRLLLVRCLTGSDDDMLNEPMITGV